MRKKLILPTLLAVSLTVSLAGCSGNSGQAAPEETIEDVSEISLEDRQTFAHEVNALVDMVPEGYMNYIFDAAVKVSGDPTFSLQAQNAQLEVSEDNTRDYVLNFDSGLLHLYTNPSGYVRVAYGVLDLNDFTLCITASIIASLEADISFYAAAIELRELLLSDDNNMILDNVIVAATPTPSDIGEYVLFTCADIKSFKEDTFYNDTINANRDIEMYLLMGGLAE